jgi:hypothetical protein
MLTERNEEETLPVANIKVFVKSEKRCQLQLRSVRYENGKESEIRIWLATGLLKMYN